MKSSYIRELEQTDRERVEAALHKYDSRTLCSEDTAYNKLLIEALPGDTGRRLVRAKSVGVTSVEFAASLIPFYELQVVPICPHCIERGMYTEEQALRVLEPMIDAGLVIPVMKWPWGDYPESLSKILARSPRIPVAARSRLPHARIVACRDPEDKLPCSLCSQASECDDVKPLFDAGKRIYDAAWNDNDVRVARGIVNHGLALGPSVARGIGEAILTASDNDFDDVVRSVQDMTQHMDSLLFASAVHGRAALSEASLVLESGSNFAIPVDEESLQQDAELRLSVAEQLGIDYSPGLDLDKYVTALAPYAGALTRAFGTDWVMDRTGGTEAIDAAVSIADEINASVAKIVAAERRFKAVGTAVAHPLVRTAMWAVIGAKVNPLLAGCGGVSDLATALKDRLTAGKVARSDMQLPLALQEAVEATLSLAPAAMAVHGMRKATDRIRQ